MQHRSISILSSPQTNNFFFLCLHVQLVRALHEHATIFIKLTHINKWQQKIGLNDKKYSLYDKMKIHVLKIVLYDKKQFICKNIFLNAKKCLVEDKNTEICYKILRLVTN